MPIKRKKTPQPDAFYMIFASEFISLIGEFSFADAKGITTITGFLLDSDENYYYLGDDAHSINRAIRKTGVYSVEIVPAEPDWKEAILGDLKVPESETGVN